MLLIATAVIFCSSLAYGIHLSHQSPGAAFYLLPSRAWELSTGAAMALLLPRIRAPLPVLGGVLSALGLLAIVAAITSLTEDMAYSGLVGALPVFGTALVVAGGSLSARNPVQLALSARPMVLIGLLSYSWYLWHWPVLALTRAYTLETANLATNLSCAGFALVLACASYRFVERPIRLSRPGAFARTGTTLAMGAAISLLMCLPAVTLDLWATNIADREPQYARLRAALVDRPPLRRFCHQKKPFVGLAPDSKCTVGDSRYSTVLVLWGDSHADHLSPLMERFAALSPMTPVLVHTFSACPPIASSVAGDPANTLACTQFNDAVLEEIARLRRKGLRGVVLAAKWARDFEDPQPEGGAGDADNPTGHQTSRNAESLALRVDGLTSLGMRVLLIAPSPHLPFRVPDCLARRSSRECSAARMLVDRQREESMRVLLAIQAGNPNVRVLDFDDYLCTADACPPTKDGKVLYLDDNHLTATASRALLPSAIAALDWVSDPRAEGTAVNADTAALLLTKTFLRR
jgi:hypothetical protein